MLQAERLRGAGGLGAGESEAIALAQSVSADWLLTDDAGARVVGAFVGLEVHGSLGVVLWAAARRVLRREEAFQVLSRLEKSSMWISPRILASAREALDELFS
jgi:predicted nucleic acid-binding protein